MSRWDSAAEDGVWLLPDPLRNPVVRLRNNGMRPNTEKVLTHEVLMLEEGRSGDNGPLVVL